MSKERQMQASKYQEAIYDWVRTSVSLPRAALMVDAKAGSGKTTTAIEALKLIPQDQDVLMLAFNRHIAEELKRRVPCNVRATTMNSYGWSSCRRAFPSVRLDADKLDGVIRGLIPEEALRREWGGALKRLLSLRRACPDQTIEELVSMHDVDWSDDPRFASTLDSAWESVVNNTSSMDFDDQVFMPVFHKLPVEKFDWVVVDEAQDLSQTQIDLLKRIAPRMIAIGDPRQGIYGFRGAAPDSMDRLQRTSSAEVLPLSISYRCPKAVVREAQKIVPEIEASPTAAEGEVSEVSTRDFRRSAKAPDWVLCRTTAPLVSECLKFIVDGKRACVRGRDIGQGLRSLIVRVERKMVGTTMGDFSAALREHWEGEQVRLTRAGRDAQLQALEDKVESIHALAVGCTSISEVLLKIDQVFTDDDRPGVTFATAHRSKGLETDDVWILCPELMPFPKAKKDWQVRQEMNLKYVAITRAKRALRWVKS